MHAAQVGKDKSMRVLVVKIHPPENPEGETAEKKLEGACDSPSSDKENASQENQRKEEDSRRESLSESFGLRQQQRLYHFIVGWTINLKQTDIVM